MCVNIKEMFIIVKRVIYVELDLVLDFVWVDYWYIVYVCKLLIIYSEFVGFNLFVIDWICWY